MNNTHRLRRGLILVVFVMTWIAHTGNAIAMQHSTEKSAMTTSSTAFTTVYLIRHAEKALDQGADPELTPRGEARARLWATLFADQRLDAIYSTNTKRTLATARLVARAQQLEVQEMAPKPERLEHFLQPHQGQTILLVGHSNTIAELANDMLGEARYAELDEANYHTLFIVTYSQEGASAQRLNIDLNSGL